MGKKNRIKKNRWEKHLDSNQSRHRWSITILDVRKDNSEFEQKNDDIISSMHDDILSQIIFFLPFKSAVQTSFLSPRWKDLWKRDFSARKGTMDDAFKAISSFLQDFSKQSQQQTCKWGFQFHLGNGSFLSVAGEPDKALHLDFSKVKHEFPWRFDWLLGINGHDLFDFFWFDFDRNIQPSSFKSRVKNLHLKSVSYNSSEAISSMISDFKFLENLTIESCNGLRSLQINAGYYSGLKKLTILDCQQLESVTLKGNSIKSFRYRGKFVSFQFGDSGSLLWYWPWLNDFRLVDAMLDFRQGPAYKNIASCGFESIFCSIKGVKSLTLCKWVFEALMCPIPEIYPFFWDIWLPNLTELWWIDHCSKERYNCNALISFLKQCPKLSRLYITIDPKSYRGANKNNSTVEVTRLSTLEDLKLVKLEGFPNQNEEIILAKRLKQEFKVEPLIVAKSNYLNCVRILVKEGIDSYKFIEARIEHLYDLCPKHVHMGF